MSRLPVLIKENPYLWKIPLPPVLGVGRPESTLKQLAEIMILHLLQAANIIKLYLSMFFQLLALLLFEKWYHVLLKLCVAITVWHWGSLGVMGSIYLWCSGISMGQSSRGVVQIFHCSNLEKPELHSFYILSCSQKQALPPLPWVTSVGLLAVLVPVSLRFSLTSPFPASSWLFDTVGCLIFPLTPYTG